MVDNKKLNKEQLEAIQHKSGSLLIIAGAGTGKTTVITERVKWLIAEGLALPDEILALTFTEKAAAEMQDRIDEIMPLGYSQVQIGTFHSFCERFLRDEGISIGLDYSFDLLTEVDAVSLFKKHLYDFSLDYYRPLGNPNKFIEAILDHLSHLKDEDISAQEYLEWAKGQPENYLELANIYKEWDKTKADNSVLEFADLIYYTLQVLRDRPQIAQKYQKLYKYILVDEYQDTNYSQNQILDILAIKHQNLNVVGDDDQAIYRFRGAAVGNLLDFSRKYPVSKTVVLTQNYRSSQNILDAAYKLVSHNNPDRLEIKAKVNKKLVSISKKDGVMEFQRFSNAENEAEWVSSQILKLKLEYKDITILVRSNSQAEVFVKTLERAGVPVQFLGPAQLFAQAEIKDLIAFLKVADNPHDDLSLYRIVAMDIWKIDKNILADLFAKTRHTGKTFFEICSESDHKGIKQVIGLLTSAIIKIPSETAGSILYSFLQESGVLKSLVDPNTPLSDLQAKNIAKFFTRIKKFENSRDGSVHMVVDWIDLNLQLGESPMASVDSDWRQNNMVNVMTIHSAKGLEFECVFMVGLVMDRFPSRNRASQLPIPAELIKESMPEIDFHLQEERRLFYVGMTRAKTHLYLTASEFYGEAKRAKKVSLFVGETGVSSQESVINTEKKNSDLYQKNQKPKTNSYHLAPISYLSYSHIGSFEECPVHYKAKYILGLSEPATAMTTFGIAIHNALKSYFLNPDQDLISLYHKFWKDEGFINKNQKLKLKKEGEKYLRNFLTNSPYAKQVPKLLEYEFRSPVSSDLKIGGRIDRVDVWPNKIVEIVDYKTGAKMPEQKEVDKNLQLSFYALAADSIQALPFLNIPIEKIKLTLIYLKFNQAISTYRTQSDLNKAREEILKIRDEIQTSNFVCTGHFCDTCAFKMLCDKK